MVGSSDTVTGSNNKLNHAYHSAGPNASRTWHDVVTGNNSAPHAGWVERTGCLFAHTLLFDEQIM